MWVDEQGVCHTVALPEPTELMSDVFRRSLDQLVARGREDVAGAMFDDQIRLYEERTKLLVPDSNEAEFVGLAPPVDLLAAPFETLAELRHLLYEVDDRWRLDALAAIEDYLS
ncbi:hypothetical protein ACIQCM_01510 [Pseudarthrobacter sp. NPDC092439]|uniref:hypothetical protein n=1 Tax=unclassified Pseudarthrobacter TaxID=2647000 RepID=UPI00381D18A2